MVSWKRWKARSIAGSWVSSGTQSAAKCIQTPSPCSGRSLKHAGSGFPGSSSSTKSSVDPSTILSGQGFPYPIMGSSSTMLMVQRSTKHPNLLALSTKSHLEGYYYKPRIDGELLEQHRDGLIALSGCATSEISRHLLDGRFDAAVNTARYYQQLFGGDYYIELQEHGITEHEPLSRGLLRLAEETGIAVVATNDLHYVKPEDAPFQDVLLCIGTNSTVQQDDRMKMSGDPACYYLKSEDEMRALFPNHPEAIDNAGRIAEMCDLTLEFGRVQLPKADVPPGLSADEHLSLLY